MRKRLLLWLTIIGLNALAVKYATRAYISLSKPQPQITEANVAKIGIGMSRREVEKLLGCPPGTYVNEGSKFRLRLGGILFHEMMWFGDDCAVEVWFGDDGKVTGKRLLPQFYID